jgi:hypothetical protein
MVLTSNGNSSDTRDNLMIPLRTLIFQNNKTKKDRKKSKITLLKKKPMKKNTYNH